MGYRALIQADGHGRVETLARHVVLDTPEQALDWVYGACLVIAVNVQATDAEWAPLRNLFDDQLAHRRMIRALRLGRPVGHELSTSAYDMTLHVDRIPLLSIVATPPVR